MTAMQAAGRICEKRMNSDSGSCPDMQPVTGLCLCVDGYA